MASRLEQENSGFNATFREHAIDDDGNGGNVMEPDADSEAMILDENNANTESQHTDGFAARQTTDMMTLESVVQTTKDGITSSQVGQSVNVSRLLEFNRELTTRHANLQAQFTELMKEHNKLQYKHSMLELATMQNTKVSR